MKKNKKYRSAKAVRSPNIREPALLQGIQQLNKGLALDAQRTFWLFLQENPRHAQAYHLLGAAQHQSGQHRQAIESISHAVQLDPDDPSFHNTLGEILRITDQLKQAISAYEAAIKLSPKYGLAYNNLGLALASNNDFDAAIIAFEEALTTGYKPGEVWNNLGVTHGAKGDQENALTCFKQAVKTAPKFSLALFNLSKLYLENGAYAKAQKFSDQMLRATPDEPLALLHAATVAAGQDKIDKALMLLQKVLTKEPANIQALDLLQYLQRTNGYIKDSIVSLKRLIELEPNSPIRQNDLGVSLLTVGQITQAEVCFKEACRLDPNMGLAFENWARARKFSADDTEWIQNLQDICHRLDRNLTKNASFFFAGGKALDDIGAFDDAFYYYQQANTIVRKTFQYEPDSQDDWAKDVISTYTEELMGNIQVGTVSSSPDLIFVCGLPRSGTSLIEQILASHHDVFGAGELTHVFELTKQVPSRQGESYPLSAAYLEAPIVESLRDNYLRKIKRLNSSVVIDKAPMNFMHLGLIVAMFPRAKIILSERELRDVGLSIFFQHFQDRNYYAYDLYDIGRFARQYQWLTDHWLRLFPNIHRFSYEFIIGNQRAATQQLLDACQLRWDENCMHFHRTERQVNTASAWQVRQPITTTSIKRWENYAPHLQPFLDGLSGLISPR